MKKISLVLSIITVLALAVSLVFAFNAVAETADEARLTITPEGGTAETITGTFDNLMATVGAKMPSAVATEYKLELTSNAKSTKVTALAGGELDSLVINLNGYTLTAGDGLISASGAFSLKINGGYTTAVERGRIVSGGGTAAIALNGVNAVIKDAEIDALRCVGATDSDVKIIASELRFDGESGGVLVLDNTKITLWESGAVSGSTAIDAKASIVRLQKSYITATRAIKTGGSTVTLIDTKVNADEAFYAEALAGDKVYLGGATIASDDIAAGALGATEVEAWYGTGSTAILHADPTNELTVKTKKAKLEKVGEIWTLTSTATTAAITTTFADGAAPTEKADTYSACVKFYNATPEVPTAYAMALLQDYTFSSSTSSITSGHANATVFLDLNGHNIYRTERNTNSYNASGAHTLSFDGADALGNIGSFVNRVNTGALLYNKTATNDAVVSISDLTLRWTNQSNTRPNPMLQLVYGYAYLHGVKFVYDASELPEAGTTNTLTMLQAQTESTAIITDSEFDGRNDRGVNTRAMNASSGSARIYAKNVKVNASYGALTSSSSGTTNEVNIANSDITATVTAYSEGRASSPITVTDTRTVIEGGKLAAGGVYFPYGEGKSIVVTSAEKLTGDQVLDDGYAFGYSSKDGGYVMENSTYYTSVEPSAIFADGMVLQANKEIKIFGTCKTVGATIEVVIGTNSATTTVLADNTWCVKLPAMGYARGVSIFINELGLKYPTTRIDNVDIGEIWMMSGQSNSVYGVYKMEDYEEYLRNADNFDNIRVFSISQAQSIIEKTSNTNSGWYQANSSTLGKDDRYTGISAIAYVMAARLAVELGPDVTVGVLDINFNGSTVEAWMSEDNLAKVDPDTYRIYKAYNDFYVKNGKYPTESDMAGYGTYVKSDKLYQKMACACYNAMIAPYDGFSMRGAVWYQGEGNASYVNATEDGGYAQHFRGVRNTFRDVAGDANLPVFIIQIPPRMGSPFYFRALQYNLAAEDANTYIVYSHLAGSTYTDNELKNTGPLSDSMVHYERKSPVGHALADSVIENVYRAGEGLDLSAPKILSVVVVGNAVKITFDRGLTVDMGEEMLGFDIKGSDGNWARAKASYADCVVTLTADGVSAPTAVRYGAGNSILVLDDGTVLPHNKTECTITHDEAGHIVTIKYNGETYVIHTNDPEVIGARATVNVVATNGTALPIFLVEIK